MRHHRLCGMGLTLLVALAVETTSWAQTPTPGAKTGQKAPLIQQLRSAHRLLMEANHDYDGHRARAAAAVHQAVRDLVGAHPPKVMAPGSVAAPAAVKPPRAKEPAVYEAQANSDAQLRQALTILQGVQGALGARHPKAAAHVRVAITEIGTALNIR